MYTAIKLSVATLLLCAPAWAGTCGSGYSNHLAVTVPASSVPSSQSNFPMLFADTYPFLRTAANGGLIQHTVAGLTGTTIPADFIPCDAESAGNPLAFIVKSYSATTGSIFAYIKVPALSSSSDTTIYVFFGNAAVVTSQESTEGSSAFSAYAKVWMLGDGSTLRLYEAVGGASATNHSATATSFAVDGGAAFVAASTQYIDTGWTPTSITSFTIESVQNANSGGYRVVADSGLAANKGIWWFYDTGTGGEAECGFSNASGATYLRGSTDGSANSQYGTTRWWACTHTSGTNLAMYINGQNAGTPDSSATNANSVADSVSTLKIGVEADATTFPMDGNISEVRVATSALSADWEYMNWFTQSHPSGFYRVGPVLPQAGCGAGYTHSRKISITNHPSSTLTNFPYLWQGTFSFLNTIANGGKGQNTAPGWNPAFTVLADMVFCSIPGGTRYPHEVDHYSASTGVDGFWVLIPSISSSADTEFYVFYGNSSVTVSQEDADTLWGTTNYKSVYHFGNGSTLSLFDSTRRNDMTNITGVASSGQISGGVLMNAGTAGAAKAQFPVGLPTGTAARTLEVWAQGSNSGTGNNAPFIAGYGTFSCGVFNCSPAGGAWGIQANSAQASPWPIGIFDTPDAFAEGVSVNSGVVQSTGTLNAGFHKIVATNAAGNSDIRSANVHLYVDGSLQTVSNTTNNDAINTTISNAVPGEIRIGACLRGGDQGATSCFYGLQLDELRIASEDKSAIAGWNSWEYTNDTSTTYTIGPEIIPLRSTVRIIQ